MQGTIARIHGFAGAGWPTCLAVAITVLCACSQPSSPAPAAVDPEVAAKAVLLGTGKTCEDDRGCGKAPAAGACLLGTCFGLLTSDSPAIRTVLVERLGQLTPQTQAFAERALLNALGHEDTSRRAQVAAIEGIGELLRNRDHAQCGEACTALRRFMKSTDVLLATSARLALANRADETVLDALLDDLRLGTPHLAVSAARGVIPYCGTTHKTRVIGALQKLAGTSDATLAAVVATTLKTCNGAAKRPPSSTPTAAAQAARASRLSSP